MIETDLVRVGEVQEPADTALLTPDGLESDIFIVDAQGREVPYLSPEARAAINRMNAEDGLPLIAEVQPEQ